MMFEHKKIIIDDNNKLLNRKDLFYKEFQSDYRQVRFFSMVIVQKAPPEIKEINLLEQQISELIKNAVKHGNKKDINKKIKVWAAFDTNFAHVIVEDEGKGFQKIEEWNEFNLKRSECFENQDFDAMEKYFAYRTDESDENDGGNALFATLEYWDGGVVFNSKKNCIAVYKNFEKKKHGIDLNQQGD